MLSRRVMNRLAVLVVLRSAGESVGRTRLNILSYGVADDFRSRGMWDVLNMKFIYVRDMPYARELDVDVAYLVARGYLCERENGTFEIASSLKVDQLLGRYARWFAEYEVLISEYVRGFMDAKTDRTIEVLKSISDASRVEGKPLLEVWYAGIE